LTKFADFTPNLGVFYPLFQVDVRRALVLLKQNRHFLLNLAVFVRGNVSHLFEKRPLSGRFHFVTLNVSS
jgi:hypothetical protein